MPVQGLRPRLSRGLSDYAACIRMFSPNVRLRLLAVVLNGTAQGVFAVSFNLYILSMGIPANVLGTILGAAPLAQALGSIPIGFVAELIGHRATFLIVYSLAGMSYLLRVWNDSVPLILMASFLGGLALAGDFVVGLPYILGNTSEKERTYAFSISTLLFSLSMSFGALIGGFGPTFMRHLAPSLTAGYRYTLALASMLILLALVPVSRITAQPRTTRQKISLLPYLWGMDRFTQRVAVVELFLGLWMGLTIPFLNVYFVYRLQASRQFYGTISALNLIPSLIGTALGPALAIRVGTLRSITVTRLLLALCMVLMGLAFTPLIGALGLWTYQGLFMLSQPIWFAYAMATASLRAKAAVAAWINLTYWLGNAIAAPVTGWLFSRSRYTIPFYLSATAILFAAWLTNRSGSPSLTSGNKENPYHAD